MLGAHFQVPSKHCSRPLCVLALAAEAMEKRAPATTPPHPLFSPFFPIFATKPYSHNQPLLHRTYASQQTPPVHNSSPQHTAVSPTAPVKQPQPIHATPRCPGSWAEPRPARRAAVCHLGRAAVPRRPRRRHHQPAVPAQCEGRGCAGLLTRCFASMHVTASVQKRLLDSPASCGFWTCAFSWHGAGAVLSPSCAGCLTRKLRVNDRECPPKCF